MTRRALSRPLAASLAILVAVSPIQSLRAADPTPTAAPAAPVGASDAASRAAAARARVAAVPEIGKCLKEPIGGAAASRSAQSDDAIAGERQEYQRTLDRFLAAGDDYRAEIDRFLDQKFADRIASVNRRYDREIAGLETAEKQRREEAIAQFERFVEKYPDDMRYTPDAMFRLAELYYERSAVDYEEANKRYLAARLAFERGELKQRPESPERSYADCVRIYTQLIGRFGEKYRYADAVYYLMGYVLQESLQDTEAVAAWRKLVTQFPGSPYAAEVWLRIGELEFDLGSFAAAADAYASALKYKESRFYDKALYKLGWTWFQLYDYDRAIRTFKDLIAWYDNNAAAGETTASALREEAIEYLAKSLSEDDWDNDGLEDENRGIERALSYLSGGAAFERDIMIRYAEALYELHDQKKYLESIAVFRRVIDASPTSLDAVDLQQRVIQIHDVLRDVEGATEARQRLAEMFAPKSPWAIANASDGKRMADARTAVELEMRRRALMLHQRAQELKAESRDAADPAALLAQSFESYKKAAAAYRDYLSRYPTEPSSYEMRFYLAETLYYSDQVDEAAAMYLEVASDPYQHRFREPAAWSAVKSNERLIAEAIEAGRINAKSNPNAPWDPPPAPEGETATSDKRLITAEPLPSEVERWLAAVEFFTLRDILYKGGREPQVALTYQSGVIALRFRDFEAARKRFRQVIACFPEDPIAADAMANILNMFREENDIASLEQWATIAERLELGDPKTTAEIRSKIKLFKLGAQFQRAEALLAEGKKLEAAQEFERLADQNQDAAFLDKAYYNAAMAYKDVRYYDSAARIFEKLVNEPRFAKSEFKTESVFELAENYKLFFAFESAVTTYFMFLERTEGSPNPNRPYALYTAGRLQEYAGRLEDAAKTYEKYAQLFKDRDDSANAIYRAAELYGRLNKTDLQRKTLLAFIERFKAKPAMGTQVLGAMGELADLAYAQNKVKDAQKLWADILKEYKARGFQPGTVAANVAAKATFMEIEQRFAVYEKLRLKGSMNQMSADIAKKEKLLNELETAYLGVLAFKALDWVIAASYRLGDLHREFAKTLYAAPEPVGLTDEELDEYITQIEDMGLGYENVAIERFEKTVQESRRLKVTTEWAEKALIAANAYKPQEYPLFKDPRRIPTFTPRFRADARLRNSARPAAAPESSSPPSAATDGQAPAAPPSGSEPVGPGDADTGGEP
jgi:TolA-binding protein